MKSKYIIIIDFEKAYNSFIDFERVFKVDTSCNRYFKSCFLQSTIHLNTDQYFYCNTRINVQTIDDNTEEKILVAISKLVDFERFVSINRDHIKNNYSRFKSNIKNANAPISISRMSMVKNFLLSINYKTLFNRDNDDFGEKYNNLVLLLESKPKNIRYRKIIDSKLMLNSGFKFNDQDSLYKSYYLGNLKFHHYHMLLKSPIIDYIISQEKLYNDLINFLLKLKLQSV